MIDLSKIADIGAYRSVICLNSGVPRIVSTLGLPIIAADGAADTILNGHGLQPDYVIGDMDSISPGTYGKCRVIRIDDQDTTDFDKAIAFAKENNLFPAIITGLEGGFLDRTLNNFMTFAALAEDNPLYLSDETVGFCINGDTRTLHLPIGTKLSIFGTPSATVTTRGLKWDLDNKAFSFFAYNSCSNRATTAAVDISANNGRVFVLIYTKPMYDAGLR